MDPTLKTFGSSRTFGTGLLASLAAVACGGGGDDAPLRVDYSSLQIAQSNETRLEYARNDEQVLRPLRNGLRLMTTSAGAITLPAGTGTTTPSALDDQPSGFSRTTTQVDGVDESDAVKYDGRYIYSTRTEWPAGSTTAHNLLDIARTDATNATVTPVAHFLMEGEMSAAPLLYTVPSTTGTTEQLVAVSHEVGGWLTPFNPIIALVLKPDRATIQLFDVHDPQNVTRAWKLELDGWLNATRMIGDVLYTVSSYRPRLEGLALPADTQAKVDANELAIRNSTAIDLLPGYRENGGSRHPLVTANHCLITQQLLENNGYTDVVVVSAINVRSRSIVSSNCLSTNLNAVYLSQNSLYVAGSGNRKGDEETPITVLHKFSLANGEIEYRGTGGVIGSIGWSTPSYFMDEHDGDLRILTSNNNVHRLSILREMNAGLSLVSTLPNPTRPEPIGKTGESVFAVRFMHERAYVVTYRIVDPLYVIDLNDPADPRIAGSLEVPGFGTYLRPLGPDQSQWLLSVGQDATVAGRRTGVKVDLFDVRDIAHPQLLGSEVFGEAGSWTTALTDPHALTFLAVPGAASDVRIGLPIHVNATPSATTAGQFSWSYSGIHFLEVTGTATNSPQLRFKGLLKTEERNELHPLPSFAIPDRGLLNGSSVFAIQGERYLSSTWQGLPGAN